MLQATEKLEPFQLSDELNKLADRARLVQLACDGMEEAEDAARRLRGAQALSRYQRLERASSPDRR